MDSSTYLEFLNKILNLKEKVWIWELREMLIDLFKFIFQLKKIPVVHCSCD